MRRGRQEGGQSKREEDTTSHKESLPFLNAAFSLVPRPLQKPCPALWERRHEGLLNFQPCIHCGTSGMAGNLSELYFPCL